MSTAAPRARTAALLATAAALASIALAAPASALAAQLAQLQASFTPDRLGASTTIGFSFHIENPEGGLPAPLTGVTLSLPPGIDYLSTTLGLAVCQPSALLARGVAGCPPNSRLGSGDAFVEVPFGTGAGHEIPGIQAVMGPSRNGNIVVLFYADGRAPVYAQLVLAAELIEGTQAIGGRLVTPVPLIASVPNGPPVSIVSVTATIGPNGLTYYKHRHGRTVAFHPKGVSVPAHCPRGGFRFAATFAFADGTSTQAASAVPCPRRH